MTRIAAVLAAALLASGCIITSDDPDVGSVTVYWDFLRYAPDNAQAVDGFIVYDGTTYTGAPGSACPESGVQEVEVIGPNGSVTFDCITQGQDGGVQGIILDNLPLGDVSIRVRGWRDNRLVWDGTRAIPVGAGAGAPAYYFHVDPVAAPFEVVAYFTYGPAQYYGTCNQAGNPTVTYAVYDVLDNLIMQGQAACPAGASAFPLPVVGSSQFELDLDTYLVRLQGFEGASQVASYDSCWLELDHFGAHADASAWDLDLVESAVCP